LPIKIPAKSESSSPTISNSFQRQDLGINRRRWIGLPTSIDDLEVLYENDEVAVLYHSANRPNVVMALYTKRGDKFSHCRTVRQEV
jgi:hypothetical protein